MPTVACLESWRGQDVLDSAGTKAGRLEEVYYDGTAPEPIVLSIKHGMLGRQVTLVPAVDAVVRRDYIRLPYSAAQIEHAQSGSSEDELSSEQVAAVGDLFKVTLRGPLYGASLIERRRIEAEEASRRAHDLELEAQQRAAELDDARKRARAAAEEANAAERAREKAEAAASEVNGESSPVSTG